MVLSCYVVLSLNGVNMHGNVNYLFVACDIM